MRRTRPNQAIFRTSYCTSLSLLLLGTVGCKEKVTILGEHRDPTNGCDSTLVEYEFRVVKGPVTAEWRQDWCAIMGDDDEMTCFLNANNDRKNPYLLLPQTLEHTTVEPSHPDLDCWQVELAEWEMKYGDYSGGEAGAAPYEEGYHPIFNNE